MSRFNARNSDGTMKLHFRRKNSPNPASSSRAPPRDTYSNLRSESEADDLYPDPERQPSHVDKGEAKAAAELEAYLNEAELKPNPLPERTRVDWSDSHDKSPWSKKTILALDGGGVKGLSSLLLLKRLLHLIAEIEQGRRPYFLASNGPDYCEIHSSSFTSPWIDGKGQFAALDVRIDEDNEDNEVIRASVEECFASKQSGKYKICHYFDYIAGTSTGGLSAIMLGRLEMSVQSAIDQYDVIGNSIFGKPRFLHSTVDWANYVQPKFSSKKTESAFKDVIKSGFGEDLKYIGRTVEDVPFQGDPRRCRTMVVAYGPADDALSVDREYLFRTYDHHHPSPLALEPYKRKHLNPGTAHTNPIWQVARATSAAPKYFSSTTFDDRTFRDGGMVANNPAEVALEEVSQMYEQNPTMIVTLGTGLPKKRHGAPRKRRKVSYIKDWGNVLKAMTELITQSEHIARRVELDCKSRGIDHYRWNVENGMGDILLDEWVPAQSGEETKRKIIDFATEYLSHRSVHRRLLQCARSLVRIRRRRAQTERWELFARKSVYFCPDPHCEIGKVSKTFFTRDELREHGIHDHSYISNVDVKNIGTLHYTCVFGRCGIDRVYCFGKEEELKQHLSKEHEVFDPKFMPLRRMEAWLDKGRWPAKSAAIRQNSELRRLIKEGKVDTVRKGELNGMQNGLLGANLMSAFHSRDDSNSSKPTSVEAAPDQRAKSPEPIGEGLNGHQTKQNGSAIVPTMRSGNRRQTVPANASDPTPLNRQTGRRVTITFSPLSIRMENSPG